MSENFSMHNMNDIDRLLAETESIINETAAAIPRAPVYYSAPAPAKPAIDESINVDKSKATILIVDDNAMTLRSMKSILEDEYNIILANSGEKAFKQISRCTPHLILLDYAMPGMTGPDVMRRLKDNPMTASIPVIFLSGVNDKDQIKSALALEPYGYLLKPVSKAKLTSTISEVLFATRLFK